MLDIVDRLRINEAKGWQETLMVEAADEIERLWTEVERLKKDLEMARTETSVPLVSLQLLNQRYR